ERRQLVVEHGVGEQAADEAALALHRGEIAGGVAAGKGQTDDEVVEDVVVQDDDTGTAAERLDDPTVCFRVVADVVEGDIRGRCTLEAARPGNGDIDSAFELGEEQRRVVGDP